MLILITVASFSVVVASDRASAAYRNSDFEYSIVSKKQKTCKITGVRRSIKEEMVIPEKIDGYKVIALASEAFYRGNM